MFSIVFTDPFTLKKYEHFFQGISLYEAISRHEDVNLEVVIGYSDDTGVKDISLQLSKYVKPKSGKFFVFVKPEDRDTARIALTIALIAAGQAWAAGITTGAFAAGTTGGFLLSAGVTIGATYLASSIIPYKKTPQAQADQAESATYSVTGASNTIKAGSPVPHLIGTHKFAPPKAMQPITESQGKDTYLTEVFCLGIGPMNVDRSKIKIGDTQIDNFGDFQIQIKDNFNYTAPIDLVSGDVNSQVVSANFNKSGDEALRTTSPDVEEIAVEIAFPALVAYNDQGNRVSTSCSYSAFYRPVGTSVWTGFNGTTANVSNLTFRAMSNRIRYVSHYGGRDEDTPNYETTYGVTSNITFNSGIPAGITTGSYFTVVGTAYNSRVFQALSINGNTINVGYYIVESKDDQNRRLYKQVNQIGTQVTNEQESFAYVSVNTGAVNLFTATDATSSATYRTHSIRVAKGQYDVRVVRNTAEPTGTRTQNSFQWSQLKSTQYTDALGRPIKSFPDELCYIAIKMRATDQLNGAISNLFVTASSVVPKYDPITREQTSQNGSGNPAWEYLNILTSSQSKRPLLDEDIELDDFIEWAEHCDELVQNRAGQFEPRFRVNMYMDYETSMSDLLGKIASIGRASRRKVDYKESILVDRAGKIPVMNLSPANISSFSWNKSFVKRPDGYLMSFASQEDDYELTELLVKRDNSIADDRLEYVEDLDASGITDPDQVYRYGKFAIAQVLQRPESYTIKIGIASLQFLRGDVINITHDRIQGVTCFGTVLLKDGNVVTVDNPFNISNSDLPLYSTFSDPESYEQSIAVYEITNINGNELTFESLPSFDIVDGQYAIGSEVQSLSRLYVVKNIQTANDMTATFEAVDYAENTIYLSEDEVSGYVSGSVDLSIKQAVPPVTPKLINVVTDESAIRIHSDGTLEVRAKINLEEPSNEGRPVFAFTQVFYRPTDSDATFRKLSFSAGEEVYVTDIEEAVNYDFKVRYVSNFGVASPFIFINNIEIIGKTTPPDPVQFIDYKDGILTWQYPNPALDFKGFKVRQSTGTTSIWEQAESIHDDLVYETRFDISNFVNGVNSFFVKSVDTSGNESEIAAKVILNLGDLDLSNIVVDENKYELGWPDRIENGSVNIEDGFLYSNTTGFYGTPNSIFYDQNPFSMFYNPLKEEMIYYFDFTPEPVDSGARLSISYKSSIDTARIEWVKSSENVFYSQNGFDQFYYGDSSSLFYNTASSGFVNGLTTRFYNLDNSLLFYGQNDDLFYNQDVDGEYFRFSGVINSVTRSNYRFRVVVPQNKQETSRLESVIITVDVEDIEEVVDNLTITNGSMRIPLNKFFRSIENMQITLQSDAGNSAYAKIIDKNETLGPLIEAYDINNVKTQSVADILIRGY